MEVSTDTEPLPDEAIYRALFENATDGIFVSDENGYFVECNQAACKLLGYSVPDEVVGIRIDDIVLKEDLARLPVQYSVLGSNQKYTSVRPLLHRDGHVVLTEINAIKLPDGKLVGFARDITERTRLENAERARQIAEESNRAKSHFMARVSHELRTPLNAVIGYAGLLLSREAYPDMPERARQGLNHIRTAGENLLLLTNDLMDLSAVESGVLKIQLTSVDLAALVTSAAEELILEAQARNISINLNGLADCGLHVRADAQRLRQAVLNILSNAIKYNRPNGLVMLRAWVEDSRAYLSITDTGIGIPAEQQHHLFEPFNRLGRQEGNVQGTGIGLVIARHLAWLMGGDIVFESRVDVGTCFVITMPLVGETPESENAAVLAAPAEPTPPKARGSVLYVEDDPTNQVLLSAQVAMRPDIKLEIATDGATGLLKARQMLPDLMLIDIHLPDMSGVELLEKLRADPQIAHIPCVALSANALPADIEVAINSGFRRYITKPVATETLLLHLDQLLSR